MVDITEDDLKRIEIAVDVLKHLHSEKIEVITGKYLIPNYQTEDVIEHLLVGNNKIKKASTCSVCALGGMMYGLILKDKVLYEQKKGIGIEGAVDTDKLLDYFEVHQLNMIEVAYEKNDVNDYFKDFCDELDSDIQSADTIEEIQRITDLIEETEEDIKNCEKFGRFYETDPDRMMAIMCNIIKFKGTFVPQDILPLEKVYEINTMALNGEALDVDIV